jgi:hypothetical protein
VINDLTPDQKHLAEFMSEISEQCYCAGWMKDLEYVLWDALESGERTYGKCTITSEEISRLKALSDKSKSWIYFHEEHEEIALALDVWGNQFQEEIAKNPSVLKG